MEVENDVDAIREQLRKEMEEKMKQDLSSEAMQKAREVSRSPCLECVQHPCRETGRIARPGYIFSPQLCSQLVRLLCMP